MLSESKSNDFFWRIVRTFFIFEFQSFFEDILVPSLVPFSLSFSLRYKVLLFLLILKDKAIKVLNIQLSVNFFQLLHFLSKCIDDELSAEIFFTSNMTAFP